MEIGFLGLGIMGKAMAMNLLKNGFKVTVWNRTLSKCDELVEHGASIGETSATVVQKCNFTIAMLSDPATALSAGKGVELTHDETTIISGALDLTEKTAGEAMTPIESTFSLDVNSKLDWEAMGKVLARGHSRVPVYFGNPKNIIGLLLVKSLLTVRPETETPVGVVSIRRMPRVPSDMPLYDILNEFQKRSSHMAAVVKAKDKCKALPPRENRKEQSQRRGLCFDNAFA